MANSIEIPQGLIFAPARLVKDPTQDPEGGHYPYGGTELGMASYIRLYREESRYVFSDRSTKAVLDDLYMGERWMVQTFLSMWRDDELNMLFPNTSEVQGSRKIVYNPTSYKTGTLGSTKAMGLLIVPDNEDHHPFCYIPKAIPSVVSMNFAYTLREEGLFFCQFLPLPPASGDYLQWGPKRTIAIA